jgi:hypothetical protein
MKPFVEYIKKITRCRFILRIYNNESKKVNENPEDIIIKEYNDNNIDIDIVNKIFNKNYK